jgi:hypothetical protein
MSTESSFRPYVPSIIAIVVAIVIFGLLSILLPKSLKFLLWPMSIILSAGASFFAAELAPEHLREKIDLRVSALKKTWYDEPEVTLRLDQNFAVDDVDIEDIHSHFENGLGVDSVTEELFKDDYETSYGRIHRKINFDVQVQPVMEGGLQQEMDVVSNVRTKLEIETRYSVLREALELLHSNQSELLSLVSAYEVQSADYTLVCEMDSPVLLKGLLSKLEAERAEFRTSSGIVLRFKNNEIRIKQPNAHADEVPRIYNLVEKIVTYYG